MSFRRSGAIGAPAPMQFLDASETSLADPQGLAGGLFRAKFGETKARGKGGISDTIFMDRYG